MGSLKFDRDQRYQTIREIASRLGVTSSHTVLDVGGGTGELGGMLNCRSFWTADPVGGGPTHIRASMDRLPLEAGSFDLVIQADALEHVPREWRIQALREMARVARQWLIWIGPVEAPASVAAEEDLCETHRRLFAGREMDWLVEHRRHGLPDPERTIATLSGGFSDWSWWRSLSLSRWWGIKRLELQLDTGSYWPELEEAINRWYAEEGWKADYRIPDSTPAYRGVFVGCKSGALPPGLDSPFELNPIDPISQWAGILPIIEVAAKPSSLGADGSPGNDTTSAQLDRIAGILSVENGHQDPPSIFRRFFGR